jgi:hypothetical protein
MVMDQMQGLGYGIIGLAIMIGIGIYLLSTMGNTLGAGTANTTIQTIAGYLGTTNGGLASWIPLIIILVVGMFFLGAFMVRKGRSA